MMSAASLNVRSLPLQQRKSQSRLPRNALTPAVVCSLPNTHRGSSFLGAINDTTTATNRASLVTCNAIKKGKSTTNNKNTATASSEFVSPAPELSDAIDNTFFRIYLPFAIAAGMFMLFDAADSGDWSRVGVITKDQELQLQAIVPFAIGGHFLCCLAAGYISKQRGEASYLTRSIKALAAGFVGLAEVILLPEERVFGRKN
jgi:hypothetical protein